MPRRKGEITRRDLKQHCEDNRLRCNLMANTKGNVVAIASDGQRETGPFAAPHTLDMPHANRAGHKKSHIYHVRKCEHAAEAVRFLRGR
jgi:hypothetical protein